MLRKKKVYWRSLVGHSYFEIIFTKNMRRQRHSLEKNVCRKFQKKRLSFLSVAFQIGKEKGMLRGILRAALVRIVLLIV